MTGLAAAACLAGAGLVLVTRRPRAAWLPRIRGGRIRWPTGRLGVVVTVTVTGVVVGGLGGPVAGGLGATAAVLAMRWMRSASTSREAAARRSAEVEVLATLAAELRAGRHPAAALAMAGATELGAIAGVVAGAAAAATLGGDVPATLRRASAEGSPLDRLAAAWQVSEVTGASLAEVVARVERQVRGEIALGRAADVELTGARVTGALLAALPLLGIGLGEAMGAHPLRVLLHTPLGAVAAGCGVAFELAGLAWVSRLTRGVYGRRP